jgi:hypothetical protein
MCAEGEDRVDDVREVSVAKHSAEVISPAEAR